MVFFFLILPHCFLNEVNSEGNFTLYYIEININMIKLPPCGMDLVILITIITIKQLFLQNYVINKVISTWLPYFPCSFLKPISLLWG